MLHGEGFLACSPLLVSSNHTMLVIYGSQNVGVVGHSLTLPCAIKISENGESISDKAVFFSSFLQTYWLGSIHCFSLTKQHCILSGDGLICEICAQVDH